MRLASISLLVAGSQSASPLGVGDGCYSSTSLDADELSTSDKREPPSRTIQLILTNMQVSIVRFSSMVRLDWHDSEKQRLLLRSEHNCTPAPRETEGLPHLP